MNQIVPVDTSALMESVLVRGDLAKLSPAERNIYYMEICKSLGLNPLTRPFEYIQLNGKLTLYAKRDCADQLRKIRGISIEVVSREFDADLLTVHVRATDSTGRKDEDYGVVTMGTLKGEARANAILKCITKAKRRVTLSICGLGLLDETEVEDIPRRDVMQPGDYDDGIPEKLTKPKQEPKYSRAAQADVDWAIKFSRFKDHIRQQTDEKTFLAWMKEKKSEISGFPPHMIKELHERCEMQLGLIRSAALADQVVHDSDGMEPRPATAEDFDPDTGEVMEHT